MREGAVGGKVAGMEMSQSWEEDRLSGLVSESRQRFDAMYRELELHTMFIPR